MKFKSAVVGALALATTFATLGGSTAGAVNAPTSPGAVAPTQQHTGATGAKPVKGDFDGDGRDDVFWYVAGTGTDTLWSGKARNDASSADRFATQTLNITGTYEPIPGDFNGDGRDDIFWYAKGAPADSIWYFTGRGTFTSRNISISGTYVPYVRNWNAMAPYEEQLYGIMNNSVYRYTPTSDSWETLTAIAGGDDYNMTESDAVPGAYQKMSSIATPVPASKLPMIGS